MSETITGPELAQAMLDQAEPPEEPEVPDDAFEPATDFTTHEIVLYVTPVQGDSFIEEMGAAQSVLFGQRLTVNGKQIMHPPRHPNLHYGAEDLRCRLEIGVQGFVEFWIRNPPADIVETLGLTPDDWLEGSKESGPFGLPVRSFRIEKFKLGEIASAS